MRVSGCEAGLGLSGSCGSSFLEPRILLEPFAEAGAGAEEQGADGGFGAVEDGGDFGDAEFVDGGEEQGVALGFGEALDFAEGGGDLAGVGEGLVGGNGVGDEGFGEGFVELVGADAAAAVDGEVPGDADEPDAEVADCGELELCSRTRRKTSWTTSSDSARLRRMEWATRKSSAE